MVKATYEHIPPKSPETSMINRAVGILIAVSQGSGAIYTYSNSDATRRHAVAYITSVTCLSAQDWPSLGDITIPPPARGEGAELGRGQMRFVGLLAAILALALTAVPRSASAADVI